MAGRDNGSFLIQDPLHVEQAESLESLFRVLPVKDISPYSTSLHSATVKIEIPYQERSNNLKQDMGLC
ncbi:Hypothetical predicted protein [Octopus vulgaris]|uniref:Uncharacterized protein n=1 Tax=Octopus vulgaris TaxID=6645 RepID=A0AA36AZK4_OCTVU|nr:Hypothetical predicted protein [Octopus vulgaris]